MNEKSATTFAMTFLVQILPGIIFAPFAGSMADRKQRKHIIVLTDSLDAVLKVILMILLVTGSMKVWMVYPLTFLSQTLGTFQNPAFNATIPLLVEKKDIPRANGFMQLIRAIQNMLAPLIAGALFPFIGLTGLFAIDFVTFFVAILTILPQKIEQEIEEVKESNFTKTIVSDLKIAFEVLKQKQGFIQIIVVFSILNFVANIAMVLVGPLVMSNYDTKIYGLVNSVSGIAMVLGGVISGAIPSEKNKVRSIFLSLIICSIGMIVMGINYSWILAGFLADNVFNPLLVKGGKLSDTFIGKIIGVGNGRGIGLLFVICGTILLIICVSMLLNKNINQLEELNPDVIND